MNLKYLRQFLDLSKYTSMNQYAQHNNVTHAQVSRMVAELEKDFGNQLLIRDRSQSAFQFTKKGETLLKRIPFIFNEIENARLLVDQVEDLKTGIFDLTTTAFLVDYWIAPKLKLLKSSHPEITLNLFCNEQTPPVEERKYKLTISPKARDDDEIVQVKLKDFNICLWASDAYIERYGMPAAVSDLSRHFLLCFERRWPDRSYPTINWYMNHNNFPMRPENVIVINSTVGIMRAAHDGVGIFSLSAENVAKMGLKFHRVLPEYEGPSIPMCFSYPKSWKNHQSIQAIESFLLDVFA